MCKTKEKIHAARRKPKQSTRSGCFAKGEDREEKARAQLAQFEKKQGVVLIDKAQEKALGYKAQKSKKGKLGRSTLLKNGQRASAVRFAEPRLIAVLEVIACHDYIPKQLATAA